MLEGRPARSRAVLQPTQLQARACIAAHRTLTTQSPDQFGWIVSANTDRSRRSHPANWAAPQGLPTLPAIPATGASQPAGTSGTEAWRPAAADREPTPVQRTRLTAPGVAFRSAEAPASQARRTSMGASPASGPWPISPEPLQDTPITRNQPAIPPLAQHRRQGPASRGRCCGRTAQGSGRSGPTLVPEGEATTDPPASAIPTSDRPAGDAAWMTARERCSTGSCRMTRPTNVH